MKNFAFAVTGCMAICIALFGSQAAGGPLVIFIDANDLEPSPGPKWNTIDQDDVGSSVALKDAAGATTAVTATLTNGTGSWRDDTIKDQIGAYAGTILAEGTGDYMYIYGGSNLKATLTLAGLDDSKRYRLEMSASLDNASYAKQYVTLNTVYAVGWSATTPFDAHNDGYDKGKILLWESMSPVNGRFVLELRRDGGGDAFLNALVLTELPEPSTWVLLSVGGLGLASVYRRRGRRAPSRLRLSGVQESRHSTPR